MSGTIDFIPPPSLIPPFQAISLTHRFIRAGEAFSSSEAISLRVKLARHSAAFFAAYHLQAMEVRGGGGGEEKVG